MNETTRQGLQALQDAPLILNPAEESLNSMNLEAPLTKREDSKPLSHVRSGCDIRKDARMSGKHDVFVLGVDGKPLTPTTSARARKLLKGKQAQPVWNKFGCFGIQMEVQTRQEHPQTAFGVDFGTKFEGYAVAVGEENNLAVMWKLPDKKQIVRKMEEKKYLRRGRRFRKCRRRKCKCNIKVRKGFLAPSQLMIVQSRLKAMQELFRCYPIDTVAMEDVRFNHRDKKGGNRFSTIETGKTMINSWVKQMANIKLFLGTKTKSSREKYGYKKSVRKDAKVFNAHCSDALAIAADIYAKQHIEPGRFIVVDDTYRPIRRKLHYLTFSKGHIRHKFSIGNYMGIRKGTICEFGLIAGIRKGNNYSIYPFIKKEGKEKRIMRAIEKINWLSHKFKMEVV